MKFRHLFCFLTFFSFFESSAFAVEKKSVVKRDDQQIVVHSSFQSRVTAEVKIRMIKAIFAKKPALVSAINNSTDEQ